MKVINEDYVSFETAKLLKEKGFEGRMHTFYTESRLTLMSITMKMNVVQNGIMNPHGIGLFFGLTKENRCRMTERCMLPTNKLLKRRLNGVWKI